MFSFVCICVLKWNGRGMRHDKCKKIPCLITSPINMRFLFDFLGELKKKWQFFMDSFFLSSFIARSPQTERHKTKIETSTKICCKWKRNCKFQNRNNRIEKKLNTIEQFAHTKMNEYVVYSILGRAQRYNQTNNVEIIAASTRKWH